ncbi:general secretion pathway protein GspK [Pararhodobacter aggregans]|uniref:general secretion pathway protein GspK n=1 Tax=Pararhodobacter aggregans TaxID=404875 RepID=UPI003A91C005
MSRSRGMALIQALLIVAAIAAVAAALLLRAETARARLEWRFAGDQAALYLDAGVEEVRRLLPERGEVNRRQDWARPRDGVPLDRGSLSWRVSDLQGRFNLNLLRGDPDQSYQAAFRRLAAAQGLSEAAQTRVLTEIAAATEDLLPGAPLMLGALADEPEAWQALAPLIAAWPGGEAMNLNTLPPPVLAALLPDLGGSGLDLLVRRLESEPVPSPEVLAVWLRQRLGEPAASALEALRLGAASRRFVLEVEARLDTLVLRRSVVVDTGGAEGRSAVIMSVPRP